MLHSYPKHFYFSYPFNPQTDATLPHISAEDKVNLWQEYLNKCMELISPAEQSKLNIAQESMDFVIGMLPKARPAFSKTLWDIASRNIRTRMFWYNLERLYVPFGLTHDIFVEHIWNRLCDVGEVVDAKVQSLPVGTKSNKENEKVQIWATKLKEIVHTTAPPYNEIFYYILVSPILFGTLMVNYNTQNHQLKRQAAPQQEAAPQPKTAPQQEAQKAKNKARAPTAAHQARGMREDDEPVRKASHARPLNVTNDMQQGAKSRADERQQDREDERQQDREDERQQDRADERQQDRADERQQDREDERQQGWPDVADEDHQPPAIATSFMDDHEDERQMPPAGFLDDYDVTDAERPMASRSLLDNYDVAPAAMARDWVPDEEPAMARRSFMDDYDGPPTEQPDSLFGQEEDAGNDFSALWQGGKSQWNADDF